MRKIYLGAAVLLLGLSSSPVEAQTKLTCKPNPYLIGQMECTSEAERVNPALYVRSVDISRVQKTIAQRRRLELENELLELEIERLIKEMGKE